MLLYFKFVLLCTRAPPSVSSAAGCRRRGLEQRRERVTLGARRLRDGAGGRTVADVGVGRRSSSQEPSQAQPVSWSLLLLRRPLIVNLYNDDEILTKVAFFVCNSYENIADA